MLDVNEALTRRVAHLARLELSDEEVRTFTPQLGEILKYVELLLEVNVKGVEPLTHPLELDTALREDVAREPLLDMDGQPKMLGPAPDTVDGGFKVPPIL